MNPRRPGLSTTAIHGVPSRRPEWAPVAPSIVQSSTYTNPVGSHADILYGGSGNTPSQLALARKYALLEGAEDAIFVGSGTAATALAHLAVLRPGDHLISSAWIYGGTRRFFDEELSRLGIDVTYVTPDQPRLWRRSVRKATRAIFVESPTSPLLRVLDLEAVARAAREEGVALLVDATFASPVNFRPLAHGADIVITSATKYLNGHNDAIAGAVAGTASLVEEANRLLRCWGPALDPHAAWLVERGLRTLAVRMERHNANGLAVAQWAEEHPAVARVHYPGLPSHPDHGVARSLLAGFGGMVGLELTGGLRAAERMLRRLKLVTHAPSLGGVESLISEPRLTSHRHLDAATRAKAGIPDGFLRLSCGLEDVEDIIEDLEQAVERE
ncbi:MAG TPA: aminotransferase class I/II-fold pyridoxal phosphate-dependent enzyme [Gemmatimonadales bacterium]|nr:aminotransferase class I/II-fold pyridoxal phosphate-dependent enzyme [Gemmatimonadales bacterium]